MTVSKLSHAPLHRILSKLGLASRTQAAQLVAAGRVCVDGQQVLDPAQWVRWDSGLVIDGIRQQTCPASKRVVMLHKRRGVVTARTDPLGRRVVCDHPLLQGTGLQPCGRLDKESEGLLLFTNDTQLAHRLTSPEAHLPKTYWVRVARSLHADELQALGSTVDLGGELTLPSIWVSMAAERNPNWCRVTLREGKNRQIRRMLHTLGVRVQRLIRVAVGPLALGDLARGSARELSAVEEEELRRASERGDESGGAHGRALVERSAQERRGAPRE